MIGYDVKKMGIVRKDELGYSLVGEVIREIRRQGFRSAWRLLKANLFPGYTEEE